MPFSWGVKEKKMFKGELYKVSLVLREGLYPFIIFKLTIFSWLAIASQHVMSGFAGHIDSWLATARQEKIASL